MYLKRAESSTVADYQNDALVIALADLGNDCLENGDVLLDQVKTRFAGLLIRAGGNHDNRGVVDVVVIARVDFAGVGERHAVANVERLAFGAVSIDVDEHDFAEQAALHERECA